MKKNRTDNMKRNKTLLVIVDCQNDFMNSDGKLYVPGATDIKENIKHLVDEHEKNDGCIIYTQDWHHYDSKELSESPDYVNTFPKHCMAGTLGAELIDEVRPNRYDTVINWDQDMSLSVLPRSFKILLRKDKFDFVTGNPNSTELMSIIKNEFDEVNIIGVSGNICVNYAALGLRNMGFKVNVVEKCIASLPNIPSCDIEWEKRGIKII